MTATRTPNFAQHLRWAIRAWQQDGNSVLFPLGDRKAPARQQAARISKDPEYIAARVIDNYEELPHDSMVYVNGKGFRRSEISQLAHLTKFDEPDYQPSPQEQAWVDFQAARTPAVLAGLEMVRKNGGSMAALPAPGKGLGPQPCKIATLVAWTHSRGSHAVQAEFDRYSYYSDRLAKLSTGQQAPPVCQCNAMFSTPHDMGSEGCAYND